MGWEVSHAPDGDGAAATERSGARGRANVGGATGGGLARGARGKGRAEERDGGEDAMAGMIYSLREFRRYTDALAVVTAVVCRLDDEANITSSPANRITRGVSRRSEIQAVESGSQKIT